MFSILCNIGWANCVCVCGWGGQHKSDIGWEYPIPSWHIVPQFGYIHLNPTPNVRQELEESLSRKLSKRDEMNRTIKETEDVRYSFRKAKKSIHKKRTPSDFRVMQRLRRVVVIRFLFWPYIIQCIWSVSHIFSKDRLEIAMILYCVLKMYSFLSVVSRHTFSQYGTATRFCIPILVHQLFTYCFVPTCGNVIILFTKVTVGRSLWMFSVPPVLPETYFKILDDSQVLLHGLKRESVRISGESRERTLPEAHGVIQFGPGSHKYKKHSEVSWNRAGTSFHGSSVIQGFKNQRMICSR